MLILHANWSDGALHIWGESFDAFQASFKASSGEATAPAMNGRAASAGHEPAEADATHSFAAEHEQLRDRLMPLIDRDPAQEADGESDLAADGESPLQPKELRLKLPHRHGRPIPSDRLVNLLGMIDPEEEGAPLELAPVRLPAVRINSELAISLLLRLESTMDAGIERGYSLRYWTEVARFVLGLLADQRFIPSMVQSEAAGTSGVWQPWLQDEEVGRLVRTLHDAMPPIARAATDHHDGHPASILNEAIATLADATIRLALIDDGYGETLEAIEDEDDPHATWLRGLLGRNHRLDTGAQAADGVGTANRPQHDAELFRDVSQWIGRLDTTESRREFALVLRLNEPDHLPEDEGVTADDCRWRLSFHLASDSGGALIDAEDIWHQSAATPAARQPMAEHPEEVLLAELTRAGRISEMLEPSLKDPTPTGLDLSTTEAHTFLREHQPVLEEAGIRVQVPLWWGRPSSRIGARLHLHTPDSPEPPEAEGSGGGQPTLGLQTLVDYQWQISLGDQTLTEEEFQRLMDQDAPLIRLRGQWVELDPEERQRAREFLGSKTSGQMTLLEALRQVSGVTDDSHGLRITGLEATGWFGELLEATGENAERMRMLDQPAGFRGTLRPYQKAGLSWLVFLDRFALGACLADDMGLGKTIQLIALLQNEREDHADPNRAGAPAINPTLLIVPTSVVNNWQREIARFAPELRIQVQHGPERPLGPMFDHVAADADVVITTYALVSRDLDTLTRQTWHRIVLDEAQYIKNPPTKQARAIRAIQTPRRVALTGTPVENRLSELWSIMEFCNPGYLGPQAEFRRRFAVPIERHRDHESARMLRMMVRPFILRRLKSDPKVIGDLPPCVESKEFATLTSEQATLYQQTVNAMLNEVESSNGIQRRGLILATLVKLKQICNHPLQLASHAGDAPKPEQSGRIESAAHGTLVERSGKCRRLIELLEEVVASDEKALVFTQYRQMGHLLTTMIRAELDCDALFLHGGTPSAKRQQLIDRFQDPRGGAPVFILSLKAGGLGLNLTAANHVFHFDRWWNPAVENQATDRAFRIGQTRTVQVHKFVCQGTLEERIDEMIEEKTELAENVIGAGEQWLTELSTTQLRDMLMLRESAMEVAE